jgi:RNA polymerase sigma factor (sigma-70 family)
VPEPPDDEDALVRRARGGDVDAYAALLRAHERAARRVAVALCGTADADEVAQDGFVKAWYALAGFRDGSRFRPWLLRIVANEARNRRRAAGRRAGYELRFAVDRSLGQAAPRSVPTPESVVVAAHGWDTLMTALAGLPARQRDVVVCRYVVGLSEGETAEALQLAPGTVKSRAARGLARLRAAVDDPGRGEDDA